MIFSTSKIFFQIHQSIDNFILHVPLPSSLLHTIQYMYFVVTFSSAPLPHAVLPGFQSLIHSISNKQASAKVYDSEIRNLEDHLQYVSNK